MDNDIWLRLVIFMFAGFLTPGPNTMMVLASGVNFGFQRSLPLITGVLAGCFIVFAIIGLGFSAVLVLYPSLKLIIQFVGVIYLLYLAYKIATAAGPRDNAAGKPLTFLQAVLVQALNVKLMGIAASVNVTYLVVDDVFLNVAILGLTAVVVNGPCLSLWTLFGSRMKQVLANNRVLRMFNAILGLLIVLTLVPIILEIVSSIGGVL